MRALLMPLIEQAATQAIISKKAPLMRKSKLGLGLIALSGFFLVAALIYASMAAHSWLLTQYDAPVAMAIMAASVLGLSAFSFTVGFLTLKKRPAPVQQPQDQTSEMIAMASDVIEEEFGELIEEYPKTSMLIAGLAGFAVSDKIIN